MTDSRRTAPGAAHGGLPMETEQLQELIVEALQDGQSLNCRWIRYRLIRSGVETTSMSVRCACL